MMSLWSTTDCSVIKTRAPHAQCAALDSAFAVALSRTCERVGRCSHRGKREPLADRVPA